MYVFETVIIVTSSICAKSKPLVANKRSTRAWHGYVIL